MADSDMRQVQTHQLTGVDAAMWQSSLRSKFWSKLAPFSPITVIKENAKKLKATIERPYPAIDFCFPRIAVSSHLRCIQQSSVTGNLVAFPSITVPSFELEQLFAPASVFENLFEPLARVRAYGKVYPTRSERISTEENGTASKRPQIHRDKDGYRKSFRIETSGDQRSGKLTKLDIMRIWDVVLPLLLPPLDFEFSDQLLLPSDLYPFQIDGVRFLAERDSALLADDMGTGKTIQTIIAMRMLFQTGLITSALIVAPLAVLKHWDKELFKWAEPFSGVTVVRGNKEQRKLDWEKQAHIWITTYGTIRSDIDYILKHRKFDLVVVDEIQNIKNRGADQSKAIKRLERKRAWGLSGTPIENSLDDIVSIFEFLKPGLLPLEGATNATVKKRIKPAHFLRRTKEQVLPDLPDKHKLSRWLGLEGNQLEAYQTARDEGIVYLKQLGAEVTVTHVLHLLQSLKQICNRDPQSGESIKLEYLKPKIEELVARDCKALVFSQYLSEGVDFIKEALQKYNPAEISGSFAGTARDREVERFQNDKECRLLIATQRAGGVGLNLQAANYVFHFDHWWNPATARQAEDRAHRLGQEKDVFVYHLWTEGTVEERIYEILEKKKKLYADVIDELSNFDGSGLSEEELFGLFDLKAPGRGKAKRAPGSSTNDTLSRIIAMNSEDFESLIARLYSKLDYGIRVTPPSRDGGVDVVASKTTTAGRVLLAIQCKCNAPMNKVGRPDCQKLLGVLAIERKYTKGIIITTSDFTADARNYVKDDGRIQLVNGNGLMKLIEESGMQLQEMKS